MTNSFLKKKSKNKINKSMKVSIRKLPSNTKIINRCRLNAAVTNHLAPM